MNGKIKVALCLSGETRSSMFCFPYIYESFLQKNDLYEVDIYIHSWKNFRALPLYDYKNHMIDYSSEDQIYLNYYKKFKDLDKDLYPYVKNLHNLPIKNTILMYYGIGNCFELTKEKKYDFYIRCRLDVLFNEKFDLGYVLQHLQTTKKDIWVRHNYEIDKHRVPEINDQFAICNYKAIKAYSNTYFNIPKLIQQTESYVPEGLLYQQLINNNITIERGIAEWSLVRKVNPITFPFNKTFLDQ
tara:strand:- start:419 stop:1147 length:729 start_codon:yes stop_codon:yes gene_type:complete